MMTVNMNRKVENHEHGRLLAMWNYPIELTMK